MAGLIANEVSSICNIWTFSHVPGYLMGYSDEISDAQGLAF